MPLMKVTINGVVHVVEAPNLRTAKTWAKEQIVIDIADATAGDIRSLNSEYVIETLEDVNSAPVAEEAPVLDSKQASGGVFGILRGAGR